MRLLLVAALFLTLAAAPRSDAAGSVTAHGRVVDGDVAQSLYVAEIYGIDEYRPGATEAVTIPLDPSWGGLTVVSGDGTVWYSHLGMGGLFSWDRSARDWRKYDVPFGSDTFTASDDDRIAVLSGGEVLEYRRGRASPIRRLRINRPKPPRRPPGFVPPVVSTYDAETTPLAYDGRGALWLVSDTRLERYDPGATTAAVRRALPTPRYPRIASAGRDGNLYVIDDYAVLVFDREGQRVGTLHVADPQSVADDGRGTRYVVDWGHGKKRPPGSENARSIDYDTPAWIAVFDPNGTRVRRLGPFTKGVGSIAVDPHGRLYADTARGDREMLYGAPSFAETNVSIYEPGGTRPIRRIKLPNDSFMFGRSSF